MELLLQCYPEYIRIVKALDYCGLDVLKGFEGKHSRLLKGNPSKVKSGISFHQTSNGFWNDAANRLPDVCAIVPDAYKFSTFVNLALSDVVNLDEFPSFRAHCDPHSIELQNIKAIRKYEVKEGYNGGSGSGGGSGGDDLKNREKSNHAVRQLKQMVSDSENVSQDVAVKAFLFLRERGLLKAGPIVSTTKETLLEYYKSNGLIEEAEDEKVYEVQFSELEQNMPQSFADYEAQKKAAAASKKQKKGKKDTAPASPNLGRSLSSDSHDQARPGSASKAAKLTQVDESSPARVTRPTPANPSNEKVQEVSNVLNRLREDSINENIKIARKRAAATSSTRTPSKKKAPGTKPAGRPNQPTKKKPSRASKNNSGELSPGYSLRSQGPPPNLILDPQAANPNNTDSSETASEPDEQT